MHGRATGSGGDGEPVVVKTTVGAPLDSVIAFGWPSFINPVILGRQMIPVILCREPGDNGQARRARLTWKTTRLESKCF